MAGATFYQTLPPKTNPKRCGCARGDTLEKVDGTNSGALWTTGAKRTLELSFDSGAVTFMDAFGLPLPARRAASGRFVVDVSDAPVYFTGGRIVHVNPDRT